MPILTLEAVLENPWNAVHHELPTRPTQLLLALAHYAADYCRTSADIVSLFNFQRRPRLPWAQTYMPTTSFCRQFKARVTAADKRCLELEALCLKLFSIEIDDIDL